MIIHIIDTFTVNEQLAARSKLKVGHYAIIEPTQALTVMPNPGDVFAIQGNSEIKMTLQSVETGARNVQALVFSIEAAQNLNHPCLIVRM